MTFARRLLLVGTDHRFNQTVQTHLHKTFLLTAPVVRAEDLPELVTRETDGVLLFLAAEPADPDRPNNLWEPLPGDHGAHGVFDRRATDWSAQLWAITHRNWLALAGAGLAGLAYALLVAYLLGRRAEARRPSEAAAAVVVARELSPDEEALRRPGRAWINAILVVAVLAAMLSGALPPAVVFMTATALALVVNYPDAARQRERVDSHARAALMMASPRSMT